MNNSNNKKRNSGKVWLGFILLIIGFISLGNTLGVYIPDWLTSWPMILIALGVANGLKHNFRHPGGIVLILLGCIFLAGKIVPGADLDSFIWPVAIIVFGIYLIVGRRGNRFRDNWNNVTWNKADETQAENASIAEEDIPLTQEDYLDTVSIFGSIKKNISSKNFRGGEVVAIMGGAEINLSQADFKSPIILDVVQIFGGTKIVVPAHWKISSEMVAIFGGIEDKRIICHDPTATDKLLIIKGTSIFGGVTIRSF